MLKTTKTRKNSPAQRKIFFEAIIIALSVHGLLLVLFVYTPSAKVYSNARTAGITFMNLANQAPEARNQLLNWLEYHEPSLISAPNVKYGYNQLNPPVSLRKARADIKYKTVFPKSPKSSLKKFTALNMHKKEKNDLSENFIFHRLGQIPVSLKQAEQKPPSLESEFPVIKRDNVVLKLSLPAYLLKDSEKLKAKSMSIDYNLGHSKLLPRVMIVKSSGCRDFDMRVLRGLSLQIEDISQGNNDFRINIQWRKEVSE